MKSKTVDRLLKSTPEDVKILVDGVTDDYIINDSGLFHWNSSIKKDIKLKMVKWYNNLSQEERQYVDDLRHESAMDEYDSHCGEEL